MATLVVILVLVCLALTFVTLAGGFDRVRRVPTRRAAAPAPLDPYAGDARATEVVRERVVERERPVVRETRSETVVERDLR